MFLLAITGSLAQSYLKTRVCHHCCVSFSFEHLLNCPRLGDDLQAPLLASREAEDWKLFVSIVFCRVHVFLHLHRGGHFDTDETELFGFDLFAEN
jgi:hypothetical protein